jgi:hypothetical protein
MAGVTPALPALRRRLDLMPSPVPERPGLLIRDPYRFAPGMVIIPPPLVPCLAFFDGRTPRLDLLERLVRATGDVGVGEVLRHLEEALSRNGFLEDDAYAAMRDERLAAFTAAPRREPAHAGQAYPDDEAGLRAALDGWMDGADRAADGVAGIAAPHVSPEGGWQSYRAAYAALAPGLAGRTFVVLGTSHYGDPDTFGLTRKPFATPYGVSAGAEDLADELAERGGDAVRLEDYCHAVEHSIEFQVVFLQHLFGAGVRVLPVLCGPMVAGMRGGLPEDDDGVARFLEALGAIARREGERLVFVLGVDMAHVGRRYGDAEPARAGEGPLRAVEARDRERCARLEAADAAGFWALVREDGDPLRWCGASPFYTFLRAAGPVSGRLLHYEQWNIDDESVVSFAGLSFRRSAAKESSS